MSEPRRITKHIDLVKGKDAVLLIHGLSGSPLEMQFVARALHKAGFSVRVPRFSKHGIGAQAAPTEKWQDWLDEVVMHFDEMKEQYETVSVCGLCIGAVLALKLAAERGQEIASLALFSTTLYFDGWNIPWYRFLLTIGYYTPFRHIYAYQESEPYGIKNEQLQAWISREMGEKSTFASLCAKIPMTRLHQAEKLIGEAKRMLAEIEAPTLIIHSLEDDTSTIRSANYVESHIGSKKVRKIFLDDSYHNITMDNQKDIVAEETIRFIGETVAALSPEFDTIRVAQG
ncbi:MAG: alpha/beta hydrolase [Burkholderiales bacterium]|nr:alpha/beta hydrolase [Burkholderiales bacterium]